MSDVYNVNLWLASLFVHLPYPSKNMSKNSGHSPLKLPNDELDL